MSEKQLPDWMPPEAKAQVHRLRKHRFGDIMHKQLHEVAGVWKTELTAAELKKIISVRSVSRDYVLEPAGSVFHVYSSRDGYKMKHIKITDVGGGVYEADMTSVANLYLQIDDELFRSKPHIYFCRKQSSDSDIEKEIKCFWVSQGTNPDPADFEDEIRHTNTECDTSPAKITVDSCTYGKILMQSGQPGRESQRLTIPLYQRRYSWGTGDDVEYVYEQQNMSWTLEDNESSYKPGKCENLLLLQDVSRVAFEYVDRNGELTPWYMGAVVVQQRDVGERRVNDVVDGQQRFTSLQLLLLAVVDKAIEMHEYELAKGVMYSCLLTGKTANADSLEPRLIPTKSDRKSFFDLLRQVHEKLKANCSGQTDHYFTTRIDERDVKTERFPHDDTDSEKIKSAFVYFRENINRFLHEPSSSALLKGLIVAVTKGLEFSIVSLRENQSATQIFDAMNSRGLDLTVADLFKNKILTKFARPESEEAVEFHEDFILPWEKHFRYSIGGGELSEDNAKRQSSRFLQDVCSCIENKPVSSRDTVSRLFSIVPGTGGDAASELIGKLHEWVPYWFLINGMAFQPGKMIRVQNFRKLEVPGTTEGYAQSETLVNAFRQSGNKKQDITRLLWLASAYPKGLPKAFHPYLVRILHEWAQSPRPAQTDALIQNLEFIISYCYRLTFIGTPPTGLSSVMSAVMTMDWGSQVYGHFPSFYDKFSTKDTAPERVSDEKLIEQSLKYKVDGAEHEVWANKNQQTKRFLLYALQAHSWRINGSNWADMHVDECWKAELEHICPTGPGRSAYQIDDKYLNSVGNYTLLHKTVNAEIKDKPWGEKQGKYKNSKWIRTSQIGDNDEWSQSEILHYEKEIFGESDADQETLLTLALPLRLP